MSGRRILLICAALTLLSIAAQAADYIGPRLEGTGTLRSGQSYSGVILTAWLGLVDGAQIGSNHEDGGYIRIQVGEVEHEVWATDIASIEAEWAESGTPADPKWKITSLVVVTRDGRTLSGVPGWLLHATSLVVELPDGSRQKAFAYPMAGADFLPENLLTKVVLGEPAEPPTTEPPTIEPPTTEPPTTEPPTTEPPTTEPPTTEPPTVEPPITVIEPVTPPPTVTPIEPPTVETIGEGMVLGAEPAIITFVVTCPHTGKPVKIRFLIVPLPATE
jgi:hypothetical protein